MLNKFNFLMVLISFASFSQNFEGEIVYSNSYKSNSAQIKDEQWGFMLGSIQKYFIKNGDYRTETNGKLLLWQLYINIDNKLYNKMANSETIYWNDGSVQGDEIIKVEINKNVTEVLGYKCDEIILTCKSGIQKYYYNSKLAVDTKLFINHKFGNWYDYLSKSNAPHSSSFVHNSTGAHLSSYLVLVCNEYLLINQKTNSSVYNAVKTKKPLLKRSGFLFLYYKSCCCKLDFKIKASRNSLTRCFLSSDNFSIFSKRNKSSLS